ncbi:MAG: chorismate-binding protein [Flavobacteriales bacterium]|nr:chorismate-binding protein [Flavobacteriales bacterium]
MEEVLCVFTGEEGFRYMEGVPSEDISKGGEYFVAAPFSSSTHKASVIQGNIRNGLPDASLLNSYLNKVPKTESSPQETSPAVFKSWVEKACKEMERGMLRKVVLSAIKKFNWELNGHNLIGLLHKMVASHPGDFVCLLVSPAQGVWLGASPELLLSIQKDYISSTALAGTRPAQGDPEAPWGHKEKEEQELVTRFLEEFFIQKGVKGLRIQGPFTRRAGDLEHLCTELSGHYDWQSLHDIVELAQTLHPTPAVGGLPRSEALNFLACTETHDRELYSGYWGYLTGKESRLFVNIRCVRFGPEGSWVYAGAGITSLSRPDTEWIEVRRKMRSTLAVFAEP